MGWADQRDTHLMIAMVMVVGGICSEIEEVFECFEWGRVVAGRDDTQVPMGEHLQQLRTTTDDKYRGDYQTSDRDAGQSS